MDHWEAALEFAGRKLGVPTFGDGDSGGGVWLDGGICTDNLGYGCVVHYGATNSGPLQGNGADSGDVDRKNLVGAGGNGPVGRYGGGGGSRIWGGGVRDGGRSVGSSG